MCSDVLRSLSWPVDALGDRAGDEVDRELAGDVARPGHGGAVERLGAGLQVLAAAEHHPLLGEEHERRAVGGRDAHEAVGGLQVARLVGRRGQLHSRRA